MILHVESEIYKVLFEFGDCQEDSFMTSKCCKMLISIFLVDNTLCDCKIEMNL